MLHIAEHCQQEQARKRGAGELSRDVADDAQPGKVAAPDLAHEVLHSLDARYRAGTANRRILPVLPQGTVLTLDGTAHRARRRALAPLFHGDSLAKLAPIIRDVAASELARWPTGRPFAVLPRTRFMTLRIAAQLLPKSFGCAGLEMPAAV